MAGIILIIMGITAGAISGIFYKIPHQRVIKGEIVSIERKKTQDSGRTTYGAYAEYYVDGVPYTVKSRYKSTSFRTGQKVRIGYNRENPEQAAIRPNIKTYLVMAGFIITGLAVIYGELFK